MTKNPDGAAAGSAAPPVRGLEDLLCFELYAASRAVTALYRPMLEELGLTYPQYLVLVALRPGEASSVKDIAVALSLDHGTLTPLLRRMEGSGLLSRRRSSVDERRVEVRLTRAGESLRLRFEEVQCVVLDAVGLGPDGVRDLQDAVRSLTQAVREAALSRHSEVSDR